MFSNAKDVRAFMFAGKAIVTFKSQKTGKHYTYKVEKPDERVPHFVKVLIGADNANDYAFIGTIFEEKVFRAGRNVNKSMQHVQAFAWVWERISMGIVPQSVDIYHEGKCGCCGRILTTPESIESGYGPICKKKLAY